MGIVVPLHYNNQTHLPNANYEDEASLNIALLLCFHPLSPKMLCYNSRREWVAGIRRGFRHGRAKPTQLSEEFRLWNGGVRLSSGGDGPQGRPRAERLGYFH